MPLANSLAHDRAEYNFTTEDAADAGCMQRGTPVAVESNSLILPDICGGRRLCSRQQKGTALAVLNRSLSPVR